MGSFRLFIGCAHLHAHVYFAEIRPETVQESLRYSTSQNLPDKVLRYITTVKVTAAAWNALSSERELLRLFHSAGQTSDCIYILANWRSPVLLIDSSSCQFLLLMRTQYSAHLLPKLQCHFAEFLRPYSLIRLEIYIQLTCVGLRTVSK
jgi:hypothetical protein